MTMPLGSVPEDHLKKDIVAKPSSSINRTTVFTDLLMLSIVLALMVLVLMVVLCEEQFPCAPSGARGGCYCGAL